MRVLIVHQGFEKSHALGAIIRRDGIVQALSNRGSQPDMVTMLRRRRFPAEVLSASRSEMVDGQRLADLRSDYDAIFLEGLPVAVAVISRMRSRTHGRIHVDVCDSWVRLADAGQGAGTGIRSKAVKILKVMLARFALLYVSRRADSVSYISDLDLESDAKYLAQNATRFVVPNGSPVEVQSAPVEWSRKGPMVVVGDWSYPPNLQMLDQVDEWYSRGPGCELDKALNVVGPNLAKVPSGLSDANIVGWVDEIESAYSGVSCALALTKSGSGVKNKVLEPLSFGIPVIATQDALNGISYDPRMVLPFRDNLSVNEINAWLDDLEMNGRKCLNAPSWDENVATVADYLLQGMER